MILIGRTPGGTGAAEAQAVGRMGQGLVQILGLRALPLIDVVLTGPDLRFETSS